MPPKYGCGDRCIDFLRRERRRDEDVSFDEEHDQPGDAVSYGDALADTPIDDALAALVSELPPKERASVLLKDVLDYPIDEVADIADSTVGGVKAALHRARAKLRAMKGAPAVAEIASDRLQCSPHRGRRYQRSLVGPNAR